jgi:hypothetical protein
MESNSKKSTTMGVLAAAGIGVGLGLLGKFLWDKYADPKEETHKAKAVIHDNHNKNKKEKECENDETTIDGLDSIESFICPITNEIMVDPVITPKGISFERQAIVDWLQKKKVCPITKAPLQEKDLITNYALKSSIEDCRKKQMKKDNKSPTVI